MKKAIIIFTRVPIPHYTKTRLEKLLTPWECANLHTQMLKDTVECCNAVKADTFIFFTPWEEKPRLVNILGEDESYIVQSGSDLGEKMYNAIKYICGQGYEKCILVGSDIPEILPDDMATAFNLLEKNDVVLGPTADRGYYLVGMKKPISQIFFNQKYGDGDVLTNAFTALDKIGYSYTTTVSKNDIDDPNDLIDFCKRNSENNLLFGNKTFSYSCELMKSYNIKL